MENVSSTVLQAHGQIPSTPTEYVPINVLGLLAVPKVMDTITRGNALKLVLILISGKSLKQFLCAYLFAKTINLDIL
jgi:hypothetical protein